MKKITVLLLAAALIAASFSGCILAPDDADSSSKESQSVPESSTADLTSKEESEESSEESEEQSSVKEPESQPSDSEKEETSQSSDSSEESEEESSRPSLGVNFTAAAFHFTQDDGSTVTVDMPVPDTWYGYEGDISLFRDTADYEEIKVAEVSEARILENAEDIDPYITAPGYTGATVIEEKMYTGNGGSSIYYYKTEAAPMGGMHEIEVWYPCFYYILMPDNTFVNLVFYAINKEDTEDFELFDQIVSSMVIKTAPAEIQE